MEMAFAFVMAMSSVNAAPVQVPIPRTEIVDAFTQEICHRRNQTQQDKVVEQVPVQQIAPPVTYYQVSPGVYSTSQPVQQFTTQSFQGGSCANGQCGTQSTGTTGFFRRR